MRVCLWPYEDVGRLIRLRPAVAGLRRTGLLFFFSSRRRHTRFDCDWSSDVCSSDLPRREGGPPTLWHFWDTTTGKQCRPPQQADLAPYKVHWSGDGRLLAIANLEGDLQIWDTVAGKRVEIGRASCRERV